MNAFQFDDYRSYLSSLCESETAPRGLRALLAREAGCQASYFSQALKKRVHLTEDQLVGVAQYLETSAAETEYLLLLLRYEKAGTKKLKEFLKHSIKQALQQQADLKHRVGADKAAPDDNALGIYFSSWIPSAVHLLTSSPETQTAESIAERLRLPLSKIKETLIFLKQIGFVEHREQKWIHGQGSFHVPKDSPFQSAMQNTRRELAARSIAVNAADSLHFSSLFTIDEKDLDEIRELMTKLVEKSHRLIQKSGTSQLACICLDLFKVI